MEMYHCRPAFPTYTVSLGCISGQHHLISPPSFGSLAPPPLCSGCHTVTPSLTLHTEVLGGPLGPFPCLALSLVVVPPLGLLPAARKVAEGAHSQQSLVRESPPVLVS